MPQPIAVSTETLLTLVSLHIAMVGALYTAVQSIRLIWSYKVEGFHEVAKAGYWIIFGSVPDEVGGEYAEKFRKLVAYHESQSEARPNLQLKCGLRLSRLTIDQKSGNAKETAKKCQKKLSTALWHWNSLSAIPVAFFCMYVITLTIAVAFDIAKLRSMATSPWVLVAWLGIAACVAAAAIWTYRNIRDNAGTLIDLGIDCREYQPKREAEETRARFEQDEHYQGEDASQSTDQKAG